MVDFEKLGLFYLGRESDARRYHAGERRFSTTRGTC